MAEKKKTVKKAAAKVAPKKKVVQSPAKAPSVKKGKSMALKPKDRVMTAQLRKKALLKKKS